MNGIHILGTGTTEDRLKDLELALQSFVLMQAVAQGIEQATPEEFAGLQIHFAEAMERIRERVVASLS